jgi:hypothetical protein
VTDSNDVKDPQSELAHRTDAASMAGDSPHGRCPAGPLKDNSELPIAGDCGIHVSEQNYNIYFLIWV